MNTGTVPYQQPTLASNQVSRFADPSDTQPSQNNGDATSASKTPLSAVDTTSSSTDSSSAAAPGPVSSAAQGNNDFEVLEVLRQWQKALLSNDPDQIALFYSFHVERYFLQSNADRDYVHRYLGEWNQRGSRFTNFDLGQVTIDHEADDSAEVRYVGNSRVSTPSGDRASSVRSVLKLRKESGDWKIFYQRDFSS